MSDINALTIYLQSSISTQLLEADPVYIALNSTGIASIIAQVSKQRGYTIDMLPSAEEEIVLAYAKKEIYMRLASSFAPDWNVETQYTKLLQSDRFTHYIKLVALVQDDIKQLDRDERYIEVQVGDSIITARDGYIRNFILANPQSPVLNLDNVTSTTADFSWNQFDPTISKFGGYYLLIGNTSMYDPYVNERVQRQEAISGARFWDIRQTKKRVLGLTPNTSYYALVLFISNNGREDFSEIQFTTLGD